MTRQELERFVKDTQDILGIKINDKQVPIWDKALKSYTLREANIMVEKAYQYEQKSRIGLADILKYKMKEQNQTISTLNVKNDCPYCSYGVIVAEKEVASDLANMANMTDQEIFLHTKQAEYEARKAGIKNFNKEEFASDLINERNQALKLLEEDMIPMTDFIQRSEPTPMQVPTPANERKKGGSVIERNPYGNYRKLI